MSCPFQVQEKDPNICALCGWHRSVHTEAPMLYESAVQAKWDRPRPRPKLTRGERVVEWVLRWLVRR